MRSEKGQTTVEMIVVVGFVLLLFTVILLVAHRKTVDSNDFKMQLDAKRVANSIADNINAIAEQGHGYYRFFTLPEYLFGGTDYDVEVYGSFVEVNWTNRYGDQSYITQIVTSNASKYCLEMNESKPNKVFNYNERVLLTCSRVDLMPVEDSFEPEDFKAQAGSSFNVSFEVFNYGVLDAGSFNVSLALINSTGDIPWSIIDRLPGGIGADKRTTLDVEISPQNVGTYTLSICVDSAYEIEESYEVDNWYNASFEIFV